MIPSWSFAHMLPLPEFIIEQRYYLCTCPVLPDHLSHQGKLKEEQEKGRF
jgi:hypothetical protein